MFAEASPNIGDALPGSLTAIDATGNTVALRDVMHGPAVLVKVVGGCPPCQDLVNYIRQHGSDYARMHHLQLVVLYAAAPPDPGVKGFPTKLPPSVVVLHTTTMFSDGFLATNVVPATFFFDKNLTLVARRTHAAGPEQDMLTLPKRSGAK